MLENTIIFYFLKNYQTYGLVVDKMNIEVYGSIGLGPVNSSSGAGFFSSSFLCFTLALNKKDYALNF